MYSVLILIKKVKVIIFPVFACTSNLKSEHAKAYSPPDKEIPEKDWILNSRSIPRKRRGKLGKCRKTITEIIKSDSRISHLKKGCIFINHGDRRE
nr:hypothetical protein Itr_chr04CG07730 [Ipomoea trifida]